MGSRDRSERQWRRRRRRGLSVRFTKPRLGRRIQISLFDAIEGAGRKRNRRGRQRQPIDQIQSRRHQPRFPFSQFHVRADRRHNRPSRSRRAPLYGARPPFRRLSVASLGAGAKLLLSGRLAEFLRGRYRPGREQPLSRPRQRLADDGSRRPDVRSGRPDRACGEWCCFARLDPVSRRPRLRLANELVRRLRGCRRPAAERCPACGGRDLATHDFRSHSEQCHFRSQRRRLCARRQICLSRYARRKRGGDFLRHAMGPAAGRFRYPICARPVAIAAGSAPAVRAAFARLFERRHPRRRHKIRLDGNHRPERQGGFDDQYVQSGGAAMGGPHRFWT